MRSRHVRPWPQIVRMRLDDALLLRRCAARAARRRGAARRLRLAAARRPPHAMDTDVFFLDVSCSDGLFCNGEEHFVDGACRAAPRAACDDDRNACTTDLCKESTGECFWTLDAARGAECTACTGAQCVPDCTGKTCGSDGCDGECGQCGANQACTDGACASVIGRRGTCSAPIALLPPTFTPALLSASKPYEFRVTGSTTDAVNLVAPSCNDASDARDQIFSFVVPAGAEWGLLASVTARASTATSTTPCSTCARATASAPPPSSSRSCASTLATPTAFTPKAAAMRSSTRAAARVRGRVPRARSDGRRRAQRAQRRRGGRSARARALRRRRLQGGAGAGDADGRRAGLARRAGGRRRRQRGRAAARSVRRAARRV